jgi:hypothetical protein
LRFFIRENKGALYVEKKIFGLMILLVGIMLIFTLSACDGGSGTGGGGGSSIIGTWVGQYLTEGVMVNITVEFRPDFTFIQRDFIPALGITSELRGTYTVSNNIVIFYYEIGVTTTAIISGNTMTGVESPHIVVTRQ